MQFSDQARLLTAFTTEPEEIHSSMGLIQRKGWTLDGVALGTREMQSARNRRRALLVLSDGRTAASIAG